MIRVIVVACLMVVVSACHAPNQTWGKWRPDSVGPFYVAWDHELWDGHNTAIREALDMYPCGMFREARAEQTAHVGITVGEVQRGHVAEAWKTGPNTARIKVGQLPADVTTTYLIVAHELGHVAGLGHDREYWENDSFVSVMTPYVHQFAEGRPGFVSNTALHLPSLEDEDVDVLNTRYCN